jgi:tRNA threonylcarbamoyladenosine modification (KEOPS) complex Cgi121 subunit
MIARKIIYRGKFDAQTVGAIYDITRKIEITGEVKANGENEVVLNLEGDPSMIKLIQHQIERKVKKNITDKVVEQIPYQYYKGVTLLPF